MSQELQAPTHVRARVVVGNQTGGGRAGAILDRDRHPLSALALLTYVQPPRGKRAPPHSVLRQVLTHADGEARHGGS